MTTRNTKTQVPTKTHKKKTPLLRRLLSFSSLFLFSRNTENKTRLMKARQQDMEEEMKAEGGQEAERKF